MPRKKLTEVAPESTPIEETTTAKSPKTSRTKKTEVKEPAPVAKKAPTRTTRAKAAPVVPEPEPTPAPAPAAKPRRAAKKVEAPAPAAKAPARRAAKPKAEPAPEPVVEEAIPAPTFRGRGKKAAAPVDDSVPAPTFRSSRGKKAEPAVAAEESVPEPTFRRGRGKKAEEPAEAVASPDFIVEGDLPIPLWRVRTKPASGRRPAAVQDEDGETEGEDVRRGRRRRRRGGKKPEGVAAVAVVEEAVEEKPTGRRERTRQPKKETETTPATPAEEPAVNFRRRERKNLLPPPRPLIPTPEEAPQVVLRDGLPTLVRNKRVYPPMMFFGGSTDERSLGTVMEELRMASEAGIHLHSHFVDFEVAEDAIDANVQFAAYLLNKSVEVDPNAQVLFRLVFKAPRGWQDRYTKARYLHEDGSLAEPSVCDDEFWGVAKACLESFIKKLRQVANNGNILGVHLDRGEWFMADGWGYDTSDAAKLKFREWARVRYLDDDVMLRASWFDGRVRFQDLTIPFYQPEGEEGDKFIRSSRKQRRYVDYHLFLSDSTVARIGELAYAAKEASEGWFLVGASYGYTFEWSHPGSGHLSLGKLLRTPELDFVAGPPSYKSREPGGTAPFPGPIDSFALNGKLYISEEDFKTSLSGGREPDDFNPMIKTPQALESVHWRGAGAALAHGSGVSWMDLWGNGWLKTTSIWDRASKISEGLVARMGAGLGEPEVCVFIDERALAYLVDPNAFTLLVQNVRESVLRAGVNAGFYLLSDLAHREKFPEAKVYIFLNAWDIRPDLRAAIKSRIQRDGKVLFWLYSAGLFDAGRDSLERAREVTGIALKPQPFYSKSGTTILNRRHPLAEAFPDRTIVSGTKLEPSYFAIPEDALVLGEYSQTGLPSFVVREFTGDADQRWTSVFLGEPQVNPSLIRALAQMAGAHVWNFNEDLVHVRPPFLTVHCAGAGPRAITLPNKWAAYNLLTKQWVQTDSTNLRFTATEGATQVFLIGTHEEIEHLVSLDPEDVLSLMTLPPKQDNTLGADANAFDIPIMKLNEWMEGGDADEVADEWFLRPQQIDEEPEPEPGGAEAERTGRRRRRRRRPGDRDRAVASEPRTSSPSSSKPSGDTSTSFENDLGINVVFRKRE